jgi:hypothetical protein
MYFAVLRQNVVPDVYQFPARIHIVPTVDSTYGVVFTGSYQPTPLSATYPQTFLSVYYPSLLFAAAMAFATGALLKNFGAQADNPQMAVSWEQQYELQKQVAMQQSQRQRSWGPGWVHSAAPLAALPRFEPMPPPPQQRGGG